MSMESHLLFIISLSWLIEQGISETPGRRTCNITDVVNITFEPEDLLRMQEDQSETIRITLSTAAILDLHRMFNVTSSDERIITVQDVRINDSIAYSGLLSYKTGIGPNHTELCGQAISVQNSGTTIIEVKVQGRRLGKCDLEITLLVNSADGDSDHQALLTGSYPVVVLRKVGLLDKIFHIVIQVLLAIINFAFGCELDLAILAALLKKPLAPLIGFCSQFVFMPVLGLAITQLLQMDPVFGMGLISLACAPGGGASNAWTILLGGDVNLSLTMTFLSLLLALGMMPLWMFITSRLYFHPSVVQIPYVNIVITLCTFVGPCFLGVVLKKVRAKLAQSLTVVIKPVSLLFLLWVITVGTYVNLYMWRIMGEYPLTIAAGILLPWCGFTFGLCLALVSRQGRERAIAIAIETGIQNMGVPIVLLQRSFPQPEGDLAATMVNSVSIFTPLPLVTALIVITIKRRCSAAKDKKQESVQQISFVKSEDLEVGAESTDTLCTAVDGDVTFTMNNRSQSHEEIT